jgi:hypothetical protein
MVVFDSADDCSMILHPFFTTPEEMQENGRMPRASDEGKRIPATHRKQLLAVLLENIGRRYREYKAATLWFAERDVPALMKAGNHGGKPDPKSKLQRLAAVDRQARRWRTERH